MPEDEWTLTDEAASIIGERRIQRAWRDPSYRFRGVPHTIPRTREPVEIPSVDRRRLVLDSRRRRAGRPQLWDYELVEMRTADIERLAQEVSTPTPQPSRGGVRRPHAGAVLREGFIAPGRRTYSHIDLGRVDLTGDPAPAQQEEAVPAPANTHVSEEPPDQSVSTAETLAPEASRLVRGVAAVLLKEWPEGRPDKDVEWMLPDLRSKYPKTKIGRSKRTLERAIQYLKERGQPGW
jgi:hypothetical protein